MSKRKKSDKKNSSDDETESFHGFTDSEIETASLKSDRSSIFSISSSGKKLKSEANSDKTGNNPSLLVLGKRQWKPSQKIKENNQSANSKVLTLGSPNVKKTENSKLALKSDVKVSEDLPTSTKVRI